MHSTTILFTISSFVLTVIFVLTRPRRVNEAIPALCGAALTVMSGSVSLGDLTLILQDVGGAAITILSTIAMALVLESCGVFQFAADYLARRSKNSGIRLFWHISLLSLLMTMLFNNDGGIIIATPILLVLLRKLGLRPHQQIPYLIGGALIDTASSAAIGVSNIVNLISLKIVGLNLLTFTSMMFVPAVSGLAVLACSIYLVFRKNLVTDLEKNRKPTHKKPRPTFPPRPPWIQSDAAVDTSESASPVHRAPEPGQTRRIRFLLLYVLSVRIALFAGAYFGIPVSVTAACGAVILVVWRWVWMRRSPVDVLHKTPWHVLLFAFGMYVVVYGIHKIGFTAWLVHEFAPIVSGNWLHAIATMALVVAIMSNLFNNHPALMIGSLALSQMHLNPMTLKVAYLGNVIGSDIGSLITPIGLLATLLWMFILKQHHVNISWSQYIRITVIVIPITVAATILLVDGWIHLIF